MDRKGQMTVGMIVIAVMAIIAGIVLLEEIFNQQSVQTTKANSVNETFNIAGARAGGGNLTINITDVDSNYTISEQSDAWKQQNCPLTGISYGNASNVWTLNTDYTVNANKGVISILNSASTNSSQSNVTYVSYTYCRDGYNTNSGSRSIAGMIGLFSALALVAFLIGYGLKEWAGY